MGELVAVALDGLATAGVAMIVRTLPWPKRWLARKPLACALCLSVWAGLAVGFAQVVGGFSAPEWTSAWVVLRGLRYLGAVAVSVVALSQTTMFLASPFESSGEDVS